MSKIKDLLELEPVIICTYCGRDEYRNEAVIFIVHEDNHEEFMCRKCGDRMEAEYYANKN